MAENIFYDFYQVSKLPNEKFNTIFSFKMRNVLVPVKISLCLKRIVQMRIKRYVPVIESFIVEEDTANIIEEILDNISRVHFNREIMNKLDLNMYELILDVENKSNRKKIPITTSNFIMKNIEDKSRSKSIPIKDLLLYENDLLFYLDHGKRFKFKCKIGYFSKKETTAANQGGRLSPSYYEDNDGKINEIIFYHSENFCSCGNKELISMSFDIMKNDILDIKNILSKNDINNFYIEMLTIPIFNIVIKNIDSSYSLLISEWIKYHDPLAICSTTTNNKVICYGLCKYKNKLSDNKSKNILDEKDFNIIKKETIKTFIDHISRLHKYILLLESKWKKVKLEKTIPIYPDYYNMYNLSRKEHRKKEKERKTTIFS